MGMELVADQGRRLGQGLAVLTSVLDPDVVVVGGGLAAAAGDLLLGPARTALAAGVTPALRRALPDVVAAELGPDAGVVGAADLARRSPATVWRAR
jgi:glucokinase